MVQHSDTKVRGSPVKGRIFCDGIGSSIDESEFDRWNAMCWKMLSLNKTESMKESEDPESTRDFQDHIREIVGCQEKSE